MRPRSRSASRPRLAAAPMATSPAVTVPPFWTVRLAVPPWARESVSATISVPPSTSDVLDEPESWANVTWTPAQLTVPPVWTIRSPRAVPEPLPKIRNEARPCTASCEFAPVTRSVPKLGPDPEVACPTNAFEATVARPPPWIVASPVPARPTVSVLRTVRVAASTVDELFNPKRPRSTSCPLTSPPAATLSTLVN